MLDPSSRARRAFERGLDALALAAGWALLGLSALVGFEVVSRKSFAFSIKGVDEIGGYVLAIASAIGFTYSLAQHGHIRVDIVFKYLSPRLRAALHLVTYVALSAFALLLAWRASAVLLRSISLNAVAPTPLATPLVLPQGLWALGLWVFALFSLGLTAELVKILLRQGALEVERHFHADRLEEELQAEQRAVARRASRKARS